MMSTLRARRQPRSRRSDAGGSRAITGEYDADRLGVEDALAEILSGRELEPRWVDADDSDVDGAVGLASADLVADDITVQIIPKRADEFTCASCFLILHMSRLASSKDGRLMCSDCA